MKKLGLLLAIVAVVGLAAPALAAQFEFHGDMNNRFLIYTNHSDWLNSEHAGIIEDETIEAYYGELKYRFWFEAADDNGNVKGVYAVEIGGMRYGETGQPGGGFSGDGPNVETRWAYLDLQTPGVDQKMRWRMGLQPWKINPHFWQETATGLTVYGDAGDMVDYQVAWIRAFDRLGRSSANDDLEDLDSLYGRLNIDPTPTVKLGLFGTYFWGDVDGTIGEVGPRQWLVKLFDERATFDFWTVGLDGGAKFAPFFLNWDLKYQGGDLEDIDWNPQQGNDTFIDRTATGTDFDLDAWFAAIEAGLNWGDHTFTYTFWYASGDDDPNDDDFEGYLAVDLDRDDSISIMQGLYVDDSSYFTERNYMLDKGFVMNKIAWDYKVNPRTTIGAAGMYMMTAEDIEYTNVAATSTFKEDVIGIELNAYLKYMLWTNVEFKINAGYLWAGDAMDAFETGADRDGNSDENIFGSSFRIRYKF